MSDDRDHTIATVTVTSEEKPYGVRIDAGGDALAVTLRDGGINDAADSRGLLTDGCGLVLAGPDQVR
jgi:hypothetical protein